LESKWRYNVADVGQNHGEWELAARYNGLFPYPIYLVKLRGNRVASYAVSTVFPSFWQIVAGPFPLPPGARFPYGEDVEPD